MLLLCHKLVVRRILGATIHIFIAFLRNLPLKQVLISNTRHCRGLEATLLLLNNLDVWATVVLRGLLL